MRFFSIVTILTLFASTVTAQQVTWAEKLASAQNQINMSVRDQVRIATLSNDAHAVEELIANERQAKIIIGQMLPELIVMIDPKILELLNENGIRFDSKDDDGYSAVMRALQFGRIDNAKKLQELGASLEGVTNDGYTVRLLAENVGLKNFGPAHPPSLNLKMSEEEASQILLYAAEAGDLETVKFALDNGASVHAKANNGWTAAMLAGFGGHAIVLKTLIFSDALQFNGIYHAAGDVDLITAILVGEGGTAPKSLDNLEDMLRFVVDHKEVKKTSILEDRGTQYRAIAEKLDYPLFVLDIFPENYEPLPRLESVIPFGIPATKENWKRVQGILSSNRFYKRTLDGDPGRGTMGALYAYFEPLVNVVRQRSIEAAGSAYRNGEAAALKADAVGAVCRMILASSTNRKHKVCGEFKRTQVDGIFTAEFSGYALSEFKENLNVYGYFTAGTDFSNTDIHIEITENYLPSAGNKFPHTQIYASVLDTTFIINIFNKKTEYFFSSTSKRKQTLPGDFPKPHRPSAY